MKRFASLAGASAKKNGVDEYGIPLPTDKSGKPLPPSDEDFHNQENELAAKGEFYSAIMRMFHWATDDKLWKRLLRRIYSSGVLGGDEPKK